MSSFPVAIITDTARLEWLDPLAGFAAFLVVYLPLSWIWPHPILKFWWWIVVHTSWRLRVLGVENIPKSGGALLVSNHVGRLDWAFIFAACPRRVRVLVAKRDFANPLKAFFLWWVRAIPLENERCKTDDLQQAFSAIGEALKQGDLILFFAEQRLTRNGLMRPFKRGLETAAQQFNVPIIPVSLFHVWGSIFSYARGKMGWKWPTSMPGRVSVGFGKPLPPDTRAPVVRQHVQRVGADLARLTNHWSRPVHRTFVRRAARHPLRPCLIDATRKQELNYGVALAAVWCLRIQLMRHLGPEPNIGLWIPASADAAIANLACTFLGKVAVNLDHSASRAAVRSAVRQAGIRQVLISKAFVREVPFDVPAHEGPPEEGKLQIIYLEDLLGAIPSWRQFLARLQAWMLPGWFLDYVICRLGRHRLDDVLTIIFTGDDSEEPKGVMLSHRNVLSAIESVSVAMDLNASDRLPTAVGLSHGFGYTVLYCGPLTTGACAVFRCDAHTATESDKLPLDGYAHAELSAVACANVPDREINGVKQCGTKPGTVGQALPGVAVKIVDPDTHEEMPLGQEGLVLVSGGNVMVGYLGQPRMTAEVIRDNWYVTGDMGRLDEEGFLTLTESSDLTAKENSRTLAPQSAQVS